MESDDATRRSTRGMVLPRPDGTRVEVSEPFEIGDEWACVAKLVGREHDLPWLGEEPRSEQDNEVTHTLFMARGRGASPEEAVRDAMSQVERSTLRTSLRIQLKTEPPRLRISATPGALASQKRVQKSREDAVTKRAERDATPADEQGWLARFFGKKKGPKE